MKINPGKIILTTPSSQAQRSIQNEGIFELFELILIIYEISRLIIGAIMNGMIEF